MNSIVTLILQKLDLSGSVVLKKPIRGLKGITIYSLIEALISTSNVDDAAKVLGYTKNPVKECIRLVLIPKFPYRSVDFSSGKTSGSWKFELLKSIQYKYCSECDRILPFSLYSVSEGSDSTNLESRCRPCHAFKSKLNKLTIKERTPKWSDLDKIRQIYCNCPEDCHVDHIVPLHGVLVSGLHVPSNLQYLSIEDNLRKSNSFIVG